jgi:cell division protease FtsH
MFLRTQKQLLARIQVSLAGLVGEDIWFGQTTTGPSSDLVNATRNAAAYVGLFGMGKSLVSVGAMTPTMMDGDPIRSVLGDPDRRKEIDAILEECRVRVRALLQTKRHVVEGVRDALLEREELIGDEIEALMADLGEREPIEVPAILPSSGNAHDGSPLSLGDGNGNGHGRSGNGGLPPRPDTA